MAYEILASFLIITINPSIENNVFQDNAKVATVVSFEKGKPDKNDISNFREVSLLTTFSKTCERNWSVFFAYLLIEKIVAHNMT